MINREKVDLEKISNRGDRQQERCVLSWYGGGYAARVGDNIEGVG